VVCSVEGTFEVRVHDVDVLVVDYSALHHHHDGECVVEAAKESEAILLFAKNAMGFFVLGACVFTQSCPEFKKAFHEGNGMVVIEGVGVTFLCSKHVVLWSVGGVRVVCEEGEEGEEGGVGHIWEEFYNVIGFIV
jgi:hypothetical protein